MFYHQDIDQDFLQITSVIDGFAEGLGIDIIDVNYDIIRGILAHMREKFPHVDGLERASPFKKAAYFFCHFAADAPIKKPLNASNVGDLLSKIPNSQNTILGFHTVCDALCGSWVERDGGRVTFSNPIAVSDHSYIDLIEAFSSIVPQSHFHIVACLLEQLVYRANPSGSYPVNLLVRG